MADRRSVSSVAGAGKGSFSGVRKHFSAELSLSSTGISRMVGGEVLRGGRTKGRALALLCSSGTAIVGGLVLFGSNIRGGLCSSERGFTSVCPFVPCRFGLLKDILASVHARNTSNGRLTRNRHSVLTLFGRSTMGIVGSRPKAVIPFGVFCSTLRRFLSRSRGNIVSHTLSGRCLGPGRRGRYFSIGMLGALFVVGCIGRVGTGAPGVADLVISGMGSSHVTLTRRMRSTLGHLIHRALIRGGKSVCMFLASRRRRVGETVRSRGMSSKRIVTGMSRVVFSNLCSRGGCHCPAFGKECTFTFGRIISSGPCGTGRGGSVALGVLAPGDSRQTSRAAVEVLSNRSDYMLMMLPSSEAFLSRVHSTLRVRGFVHFSTAGTIARFRDVGRTGGIRVHREGNTTELFLSRDLGGTRVCIGNSGVRDKTGRVTSGVGRTLNGLISAICRGLSCVSATVDRSSVHALFGGGKRRLALTNAGAMGGRLTLRSIGSCVTLGARHRVGASVGSVLRHFLGTPCNFMRTSMR